jgi:hypothetical protein
MDRLFNDFTRRARGFFNNSRPSSTQGLLPAPVSIEKAADALMCDWREFIECFLCVAGSNVAPMYGHLSPRLSFIAQMLQGLVNAYDKPHPLIAIRPIRRAQRHLEVLKLEALRLAEPTKEGFDLVAYHADCVKLAEQVYALFPEVFPNNSVTLGGIVATKRDLLVACDNTIALCEGIRLFDEMIGKVTEAIVEMGQAFRKLFVDLRISRMVVAERLPPSSGQKSADEEQSTPSDSVDRIRNRLRQMDADIADTSKLYAPKSETTVPSKD